MPKEMLINVSEGEECRIALVEDGKLEELYMERTSSTSHVGNIYKGKVTNVEASIQAAFIDFGLGRNGFLHISDLMPTYFGRQGEDIVETVGKKMARRDRPPIQRCLRRGDEIIVQIIKEGIGTKGPTLSSYLSIPGRFLVMMPGVGKMGVSQKIEDDAERRRLRQILDGCKPPKDVGFIIRTAGVGKSKLEIERDLKYLTRLWENLVRKRDNTKGTAELYTEGDLVTRTVRDVFTTDVERIVVDNADVADRVEEVIRLTSPRTKDKVILYEEKVPLFHKYGIEREIELMYSRHVPLPSGGSLVIDSTEAIVAIDVNSGKNRASADAETTAFKVDMEAADEIARQLRLRDLGGVIICDFIDLRYERHRRELEERLLNHLKNDRAKTKMLRMSQFGIIEMTRQRMRPSLKRAVYFDCPHCKGAGLVKTHESMSLDVMRRLAIAISDLKVVRAELSVAPDVAFYLQNRNRRRLVELEEHFNKRILIKSDAALGLDEMKLTLFDSRDGLVMLDQLVPGLAQPRHVTQLGTRPYGAGQPQGRGGPPGGRRDAGGGQRSDGRRGEGGSDQQGQRRGGGRPHEEDPIEEDRYNLDGDREEQDALEPHEQSAPQDEGDFEELEADREPSQEQRPDVRRPQGRGNDDGGRGRNNPRGYQGDRPQGDRESQPPRDDRPQQGRDRGDAPRRDDRPAQGQGQGRDRGGDDRQPQRRESSQGRGQGQGQGQGQGRGQGQGQGRGQGLERGRDDNRGIGGPQQGRGRNDRGILDERDERGRGTEAGGEGVIYEEEETRLEAPPVESHDGQGPPSANGQGEPREGEGGARRRRRRRGRRGRGRGQGGPQLPGQPDDALAEGSDSDEDLAPQRTDAVPQGGYDDGLSHDLDDRHEDEELLEHEDRHADEGHAEVAAGHGDDDDNVLGEAPAELEIPEFTPSANQAFDDEEEESEDERADGGDSRLGGGVSAAAAAEAPEAEIAEPAPRGRGGRGRGGRAAAVAAEAPESEQPAEGDAEGEAAPAGGKRRRRSRGGRGRRRSGAAAGEAPAAPDETSDASGEPAPAPAAEAEKPAKKSRAATSRSRTRKKATPVEADAPAAAPAPSSRRASPSGGARIASPDSVAPTKSSADKHMADDEPVEHEPVRRPRSFRDLDELPEEFD